MDANRHILELNILTGINCVGHDFLNLPIDCYYDRIIANPPFSKNQDIEHVQRMYKHLRNRGRIVSVMSNSWRIGNQKKQVEFREWLQSINAEIQEVESGTFKESGTNIAACIVIIQKKS